MAATLENMESGTELEWEREEGDAESTRAKVRFQVRRYGIADADADQVVDEVLDAWNELAFDPAKANGAKAETVLNGLIWNRCKMAMRRLARNRTRDSQHTEMVADNGEDRSMIREVPLRIDVQYALSKLHPTLLPVCHALANEVPHHEIMETLGISRRCLREAIDSIRRHFTALGLKGWVAE